MQIEWKLKRINKLKKNSSFKNKKLINKNRIKVGLKKNENIVSNETYHQLTQNIFNLKFFRTDFHTIRKYLSNVLGHYM